MFVKVEDVIMDASETGQIEGFVFSFEGDVVEVNRSPNGKNVVFHYMPKTPEVHVSLANRVQYNWDFNFNVAKIGFWNILNFGSADPKYVERCWGIYAAGLDQFERVSGRDLECFRGARDYLAKKIRKGLRISSTYVRA